MRCYPFYAESALHDVLCLCVWSVIESRIRATGMVNFEDICVGTRRALSLVFDISG
jgi:hypothetical protein